MNKEFDELLDDVFTVKSEKKVFIPSQTGLPNPDILDYEQAKFIKESMEYLKEEIVVSNYEYPTSEGISYNLLLDCVVIKRKDYDRIKDILETYE
jgi:hypothetical protein